MIKNIILLVIVFSLYSFAAIAITIEARLSNKDDELKAVSLFKQMKCVICDGESINDSKTDLAKNLRSLIRDKIKQGYSDHQIKDFIVDRYGQEILMQPEFNITTSILWVMPIICLIFGSIVLFRMLKT